jgi:Family of unknown function (DUF5330)
MPRFSGPKLARDSVGSGIGGFMGLFRKIILVAGGLAFLPSPPDAPVDPHEPSQASYLAAAFGAVSDAAGFCGRQPGVCETAGHAAAAFERRAKYSAELIYEWANREGPTSMMQVDALETGTTDARDVDAPSASTLKIDDLLPSWIGPLPKKG